jgi:hypothetical protein
MKHSISLTIVSLLLAVSNRPAATIGARPCTQFKAAFSGGRNAAWRGSYRS